jgi:tartrate/fumarate subfamily iron-sulfur-dependent hydro-lyase alpha chain
MLKGGGSDNASRLEMLNPGDSWPAIRQLVLETVLQKAANACPPLVVGVAVGSTFDKVAALAKQALIRPLWQENPNPHLAELETELLEAINQTGIGPAGLGGETTALAVHLVTAACHLAALPVAVNLGCSAMRSVTLELTGEWA